MEVLNIIKDYVKKYKNKEYINIEGQSEHIPLWLAWYRGYVSDFHTYKVYRNDGTYVGKTKKSLGAAQIFSSDWANLIANEKNSIGVKEKHQEMFNNIMENDDTGNHFFGTLPIYVELGFALSISTFVLTIENITVDDNGRLTAKTGVPKISFLKATQIYPVTIENKTISECAFVNVNTNYANITIHLKDDDGTYKIHNLKCKKSTSGQFEEPDEEDITVFNTLSKRRWFGRISPAIANNIDIDSDLPISIYANSLDVFKSIDNKYDGFDQEYDLGKRRLFVSTDYQKTIEVPTKGGTELQYVPTFDNNDALFYTLPNDRGDSNGNKIYSVAEPLRANDYIAGLNQEFNFASKKCGFGLSRYQFDASGRPIQTATGVISQNSELYQNLRKHEKLLESELKEFTLALIEACNNFTEYQFGEYQPSDIKITFDDSIIEDTDSEQNRDRSNVAAGLMSEEEFVQKWLGYNEEDAKSYVLKNLRWKKLQNYATSYQTGMISTKYILKECYPDLTEGSEEYNELYTYLEENKSAAETTDQFGNMYGNE